MEQILLNDLLHFPKEEFNNIKIRFNQHNGYSNPMELYQQNPEEINTRWLFWREQQRYFNIGQIAICFLKLTSDTWLLTTIKKVTKELNVHKGINYEGVVLEEYKKYYGRVIVHFHKHFQTQGVFFEKVYEDLVVNQILPTTFDGFDFPGYDNVRLTFSQLEAIIALNKKDWVAALQNQKAVYLITDTHTGKLYVGAATSDCGMLLQRWQNYVANGHGGNKELQKLDFDYIKKYFQYSILENYNAKVDDKVILARESWWKETLQSRTFGYNDN